ncbi:hypothetical protein CCR75_001761 [Bremia lactucae]|uniref:Uncharacterized protein n=1 Tax=Bremia lactucae TaxID=4779 RepID=A0A976IH26_BRELC|nr:hypothetical protein CCR75_001761 [Bremia lactucae]
MDDDLDSGDLYSGLTLPKKTKRERLEEEKNKEKVGATAIENVMVKRQRMAEEPPDLRATVAKLERYMLISKKFAKASALYCQLIKTQLTIETSELFLTTLTNVIDEKGEFLSGQKDFQTLIETLDAKQNVLFSVKGAKLIERRQKLDTWKILAITHAELFTDETYQFNKAAKKVKHRFEEIVHNDQNRDEDIRKRRLHSELMPLLRTLYSKLSTPWATTIVESVLALGTRYRLLFTEQDRVEIDKWTKRMQDWRNAPAITRSAGSDARRNLVPAKTSKMAEAGAKVPGIFNHPLFNKDV